MIVLLMPHCQPFLHELFAALGVHADAHWVAGRRGIVAENLPHLVNKRTVAFRRYSDGSRTEQEGVDEVFSFTRVGFVEASVEVFSADGSSACEDSCPICCRRRSAS